MKEFLEKSLRQQVTIMEDKELYKKFPLVYRGRYDIFKVEDLLKHYLQKKFHILKHSLSIPAPCGHGNIEPHQF